MVELLFRIELVLRQCLNRLGVGVTSQQNRRHVKAALRIPFKRIGSRIGSQFRPSLCGIREAYGSRLHMGHVAAVIGLNGCLVYHRCGGCLWSDGTRSLVVARRVAYAARANLALDNCNIGIGDSNGHCGCLRVDAGSPQLQFSKTEHSSE